MATIRKRNHNYEITVSLGLDSSGNKIREYDTFIPDPKWSESRADKEARKYADRFEDKVKSGYNPSGDKITFEKLSRMFLEEMKIAGEAAAAAGEIPPLAETTLYGYQRRLELRIIPAIGQMKLTQITNHVIKQYTAELRKDGARKDCRPGRLSESTVTKDRAVISTILSYGVEEGFLSINPLIYAGKRRGRKKAQKEYVTKQLTVDQTKWFLWAMDNPIPIRHQAHTCIRQGKPVFIQEYVQLWSLPLKWRLYFYISLFTGNRRGENIALRWKYFDFEKNTILVEHSTAQIPGKVIQKDTKTHAARVAAVPPMVMTLARELLSDQKERSLQLGDYWKGYRGKNFKENFVFIQDDGQQMNLCSPRTEFKRLIRIYNTNVATSEEEQIPEDLTPHDLRHTAASILIRNGMDPQSVAGVLGHADPTTTLNIYSYFFREANQEAANIMSSVLLSSSKRSAVGN